MDTSGKDWMPSSVYVPADAGDPFEEFVRQWAPHTGHDLSGQNPREIVAELVRRHGLVVVGSGKAGVEVLSRTKSPDFDEDQMAEVEDSFDTNGVVKWRPAPGIEPSNVRGEVVFRGEYDYVNKQPDRVAAREREQAQAQAAKADRQTSRPKPQPGGSRWNPDAPVVVSKSDQDEFDALVKAHNSGKAGLATASGRKQYKLDTAAQVSKPRPKPKEKVYQPRFLKGGGGFVPGAKIRGLQ